MKRVEYGGFSVTVLPVTRRASRERWRISEDMKERPENEHGDYYMYRTCLLAASDPKGFELSLSFDEYLDLPEKFTGLWAEVFVEINEHWFPKELTEEDKEKKSETVTDFTDESES